MQATDKRKQNVNSLVENYGPLGPRHLLAAALLMQRRDDEKKAETKGPNKAAA